jgi:histidyl-tRNA synthetase
MGVERLFLLLEGSRCEATKPDVFLAALGEKARREAFNRMHHLQRRGIRAEMEYQTKSLKAQMRRADKLGARFVLILGEDELTRGVAQLRDMADSSQREVELAQLEEVFVPSPNPAATDATCA